MHCPPVSHGWTLNPDTPQMYRNGLGPPQPNCWGCPEIPQILSERGLGVSEPDGGCTNTSKWCCGDVRLCCGAGPWLPLDQPVLPTAAGSCGTQQVPQEGLGTVGGGVAMRGWGCSP